MSREQIQAAVEGFIAYVNKPSATLEEYESIISKDVVQPLPYPGSEPTFDGLRANIVKAHAASHDFWARILDIVIDEKEHKAIAFIQNGGTHTG